MADPADWSLVFYTTTNGDEPVREFLESLDQKTQVRFEWSLEQLRVLNVQARAPLVKHIEGKLWELRRASSGNIYRVMYFFFTGRQIVLVHGFQKKTQKTPRSEIALAEQRMADFLKRAEGGE
jgi:phage-related protein